MNVMIFMICQIKEISNLVKVFKIMKIFIELISEYIKTCKRLTIVKMSIFLFPNSAKPKLQLRWLAELALISLNPATHPANLHPHP